MTPPASEQVTPFPSMVLVDMLLRGKTLVRKERKSDEELAKGVKNEYSMLDRFGPFRWGGIGLHGDGV